MSCLFARFWYFKLYSILLLLALPLYTFAEIQVENDRFNGATTIHTKARLASSTPYIHLLGIFAPSDKQPTDMGFMLVSRNKGWRYLDCHSVYFLLDNKKFSLPGATHDGSVTASGLVVEYVRIRSLTMKQIEEMAQSKKIEYKICNDEYTVTPEDMRDIRTFYTKMKQYIER
jgi:hypothetical protein